MTIKNQKPAPPTATVGNYRLSYDLIEFLYPSHSIANDSRMFRLTRSCENPNFNVKTCSIQSQ